MTPLGWGGDLPSHMTSWFGMSMMAKDLVRGMKTFIHPDLIVFFSSYKKQKKQKKFFFWCVVQQYDFSLIYSIGSYGLYNVQWFHFRK